MTAFKTVALLLIFLACEKCNYGQRAVEPRSLRLNSHLGPGIRVIGTLPERYTVDKMRVTYRTNSSLSSCNGLNFPDGGAFPLRSNLYVPMTRSRNEALGEIQPDRYASGPCRWQLTEVYAVLKDGDRDETQPLVGINYVWYRDHGLLGDEHQSANISTFFCGYEHKYFGCDNGKIGDMSSLPIELHAGDEKLRFAIHDSGYHPPPGYRAPCRDDTGVQLSRCPGNGA